MDLSRAPRRARSFVVGGIPVDDPYSWLEEPSAETLAWQSLQNARAIRHLREWEGFDAVEAEVLRSLDWHAPPDVPVFVGGRWFLFGYGPTSIDVSDAPTGPWTRVFDDARSCGGFWPSPDGRTIAFTVYATAWEQGVLHLFDLPSGRLLPERFPYCSFSRVTWSPDGAGFWFVGGLAPDMTEPRKYVFRHDLGGVLQEPEPLPYDEYFPLEPLDVQVAPDGRYVATIVGGLGDTDVCPRAIRRPDGGWTAFLDHRRGDIVGDFFDDRYIAITNEDADAGRVVAIPLDEPNDRSRWYELVAESGAVLRHLSRVEDRFVLLDEADGSSSLSWLDPVSGALTEIVGRGRGSVSASPGTLLQGVAREQLAVGTGGFAFSIDRDLGTPSVWWCGLGSATPTPIHQGRDHDDLIADRHRLDGGAEVTVFARASLDGDGPRPFLLWAYGGWNYAVGQGLLRGFDPLLDRGARIGFARVRGGGEFGRAWREGGRGPRKAGTYDDVIAIAEALIERGIAEPGRLGFQGISNGGLTAAVMATRGAHLFRVVVTLAGGPDALRNWVDPWDAKTSVPEFGEPRDPATAPAIAAYSPYYQVVDGTAYPAVLAGYGDNDVRAASWQGRKFIARLQHASTSGSPVLLRIWPGKGHSVGLDPETMPEWLSFVIQELGLPVEPLVVPG